MSGLGRTGGYYPGPSRTGGAYPLLRRVMESLATARGTGVTSNYGTAVWAENMALARCLTFSGYGAAQRMSANFLPTSTSAAGLLPRWERIFGLAPPYGSTEPQRRAALTAAWQSIATPNTLANINAALSNAMGAAFVGVSPNNAAALAAATIFWPAGSVPGYAPLANASTPGLPWYSTICNFAVQMTLPSGWTMGQIVAAQSAARAVLDPLIPAWYTINFFGVDSTTGSIGFVLDSLSPSNSNFGILPNNLDWDVFSS